MGREDSCRFFRCVRFLVSATAGSFVDLAIHLEGLVNVCPTCTGCTGRRTRKLPTILDGDQSKPSKKQ